MDSIPQPINLTRTIHEWWKTAAARQGYPRATAGLLSLLWEFLRNSTPERLRSRFGDAEYDWDHRVNTTSGAVPWRERLLGMFHSPYMPTEPAEFDEMLRALQQQAGIDVSEFTFVDLGSGKGRTLLMASAYPFRRIVGVELLPALHEIAQENLRLYKSETQQCSTLEAVCGDATEFPLPDEPLVVYLFNPFPEAGLRRVVGNLEQSLREHSRQVLVLYHNALLEHVLAESGALRKIAGTETYSIFGVN